jgi:hypothetical protein
MYSKLAGDVRYGSHEQQDGYNNVGSATALVTFICILFVYLCSLCVFVFSLCICVLFVLSLR